MSNREIFRMHRRLYPPLPSCFMEGNVQSAEISRYLICPVGIRWIFRSLFIAPDTRTTDAFRQALRFVHCVMKCRLTSRTLFILNIRSRDEGCVAVENKLHEQRRSFSLVKKTFTDSISCKTYIYVVYIKIYRCRAKKKRQTISRGASFILPSDCINYRPSDFSLNKCRIGFNCSHVFFTSAFLWMAGHQGTLRHIINLYIYYFIYNYVTIITCKLLCENL